MSHPQETSTETKNLGLAAALIGAAAGAAALFLASPRGKQLQTEFTAWTEIWLAHASSAVAQTRERVISEVEDTPLQGERPRQAL